MFRLLKSGLPKDPIFPTDLEGLGYFINEDDEVRMIANPRAYFDFFKTKNDRHNCVRREAMNTCLRDEILNRLQKLGLDTVRLPLGAGETEAHVPILVSSGILLKKRVIILFYEHTQDLGVFAYRVVGGRGGINAGSAVNFVKYIQSLSGLDSEDSPGIILTNLGQLRWWRRGKKAITQTSWYSLPQTSAVGGPYRFDIVNNTIPGNRNTAEHIAYIFHHVVPKLLAPEATLEVIGVSVGAVDLVDFLNKPKNWEAVQPRLTALALVAPFHQRDEISNPWFADWLRKRGRAYVVSNRRASTAIATSEGNIYVDPEGKSTRFNNCFGCPVFSLGEPHYSEMMLPTGYKTVLDWFQEAAAGGDAYENPEIIIANPKPFKAEVGGDIDFEEAKKCLVLVQGRKRAADAVECGMQSAGDEGINISQARIDDTNDKEWEPVELNIAHLKISESIIDAVKDNLQPFENEDLAVDKTNPDPYEAIDSIVLPFKDKKPEPLTSPSYIELQKMAAQAMFEGLQRHEPKLPEQVASRFLLKARSGVVGKNSGENSKKVMAQNPQEKDSKNRNLNGADMENNTDTAYAGVTAATTITPSEDTVKA